MLEPSRRLPLSVLLLLCVTGWSTGCGSGGMPDMVKVRGKVSYNGEPITEGSIVYLPTDSNVGRQATGAIQPDGTFELMTMEPGDGVKKGDYRIAIFVYQPHPGEPGRTGDGDEPPAEITRGFKIPEKYTSALSSGLTDSVDDDHPGYREFELTD